MNNYFRITGYCPACDQCFIIDSYGVYEQLWQFSSILVTNGYKILEISDADKFLDVNIKKIDYDNQCVACRISSSGKPETIIQELNGIKYKAIKVADKVYIPDKTQTI